MVHKDNQHAFVIPSTRQWFNKSWRSSAVLMADKHYMDPIFTKYAPNHVEAIILKHFNATLLHMDVLTSPKASDYTTKSQVTKNYQYHFRIDSFFVHDLYLVQSIHYEPHDPTSPSGQYILNFIISARKCFYDMGHNKKIINKLKLYID